MPRRLVNQLLLALLVVLGGSGLLGWLLPLDRAAPLFVVHRAAGIVLLVAVVAWKQRIARASLGRRLRRPRLDRSLVPGLAAALGLLGALGLGLAWSLDLVSFRGVWGYSALSVHVLLGLGLLPFVIWHALRRGERRPEQRRLLTRRSALRLLGLAAAALLTWQLSERAIVALTPAGVRRPTGSKHAGSFSASALPVTSWLLDAIPGPDLERWRLEVRGQVRAPGLLTYSDLEALPRGTLTAVLDCTGGWWSEQEWVGVWLRDLLASHGVTAGARAVEVVSVTGHRWGFPLAEASGGLLATHVGGQPLSAGHGFPLRLVMPGRRGFQWVKWVGRIEVL